MDKSKLYVSPKGIVFCGDAVCVSYVKQRTGEDDVRAADEVTAKMKDDWLLAIGARICCSRCGTPGS